MFGDVVASTCTTFLEGELHLQIDAAVRASGRIGPVGHQGVRFTKERRAENAVGRGEIHDVQNVARGDAESQVITAIGGVSPPTPPILPPAPPQLAPPAMPTP